MEKRIINGAVRHLGYTNKANGYWDLIKYKDNFKLFCTITPLSNKNKKMRYCDMIDGTKSQSNCIDQFEIHFSEKEIKELKNKMDKAFKRWFKK